MFISRRAFEFPVNGGKAARVLWMRFGQVFKIKRIVDVSGFFHCRKICRQEDFKDYQIKGAVSTASNILSQLC